MILNDFYYANNFEKQQGKTTNIYVSSYLIQNVSLKSKETLVYSPLPGYLLKRLQKIEFAAASFVYGRYVNDIGDILKLNWLPVKERRDFNLLKLTFKALHAKQWPSYLNLQRVSIRRGLRSSDSIRLQVPLEKGTFQDTAVALFNNLV